MINPHLNELLFLSDLISKLKTMSYNSERCGYTISSSDIDDIINDIKNYAKTIGIDLNSPLDLVNQIRR